MSDNNEKGEQMSERAIMLLGGAIVIGLLAYTLVSSHSFESNDVYEPKRVAQQTKTVTDYSRNTDI